MELKEWVKSARTHAGLTIEQLAHALGRSKAAAGFWETGATKPSYAQLLKIAEITGYAMPETIAASKGTAISIKSAKTKLWPFLRIDYEKFVSLTGSAARAVENAVLAAASDMDVDVRPESAGNRKAS